MQNLLRYIKNKRAIVAIAILYTLFIFVMAKYTGIVTNNEAEKYISGALAVYSRDIKSVFNSQLFYLSYILFVSIFFITKNAIVVVVAQSVLSFTAGVCLKKITDHIIGRSKYAYISMLIFLFAFPIQSWTVTLFSDSFFISLSVITLFYTIKEKSNTEVILWLCLNLLLIFARPPGIFLVLPNITYFIIQSKIAKAITAYIAYSLIFTVVLFFLFYMPAETKGYIKPIAAERIIVDSIDYTVPKFTTAKKSTIAQAYTYISHKNSSIRLGILYIKKTLSFFTLNRPYYSRAHNFLLLPFYLFYVFSIVGIYSLWKSDKKNVLFLFTLSIFGLTNLVALTYNEWHYRFTITIFPFLIILSTISVFVLFKRKKLNKNQEDEIIL